MQKGKFRIINNDTLMFYCPGCELGHTIKHGGNGWSFDGDFDSPTISPSVLTRGRNLRCHLFLKKGILQFLSDCTHKLKSQSIPIPDLPDWMKD